MGVVTGVRAGWSVYHCEVGSTTKFGFAFGPFVAGAILPLSALFTTGWTSLC